MARQLTRSICLAPAAAQTEFHERCKRPSGALFFMPAVVGFFGLVSWWLVFLTTDHYLPWVSWHGEALAYISISMLTLATLAGQIEKKKSEILLPPAVWLLAGFFVLVITQKLLGKIPYWGVVWVLFVYLAACGMALYVGQHLGTLKAPAKGGDGAVFAAGALLVAALLCAVEAWGQSLALWDHAYWLTGNGAVRRPGSNLSQPNHLATMLVLGVASTLYIERKKLIGHVATSFVLIVLSLGIVVAESRSGLLSYLVLLAWACVGHGRSPKCWLRLLSFGGTVITVFWYWPTWWDAIQFNAQYGATVNTTSSGRLELWAQTLQMIAEKPLTGWGFGQYGVAQNWVASRFASVLPATYAHNAALDFAIWFGLPLSIAFFTYLTWWVFDKIKYRHDEVGWYCLALLAPIGIHAMLEYPHAYMYFLVPAMVAIGALEALAQNARPLKVTRGWFALFLLTQSFVAGWSAIEYLRIEEDFRVARFESARVGQVPADYARSTVYLLDHMSAMVDVIWLRPRGGMSADEMESVKHASIQYPWRALLSKYAVVLALNGQAEAAAQQLAVIRAFFGERAEHQTKQRIGEAIEAKARTDDQ